MKLSSYYRALLTATINSLTPIADSFGSPTAQAASYHQTLLTAIQPDNISMADLDTIDMLASEHQVSVSSR